MAVQRQPADRDNLSRCASYTLSYCYRPRVRLLAYNAVTSSDSGAIPALLRKWKQSNQGMTYLQFRRSAMPMFGDPAIVIKWCNMFLAIEPDGYTHS